MDAVEILLVFAPIPLIWGLWCKLWDWTCMWCAIALVVVGIEVAAVYGLGVATWIVAPLVGVGVTAFIICAAWVARNQKKTISRHFWLFQAESPSNFFKAICCGSSVLLFFVYLIVVHLWLHFSFLKLIF